MTSRKIATTTLGKYALDWVLLPPPCLSTNLILALPPRHQMHIYFSPTRAHPLPINTTFPPLSSTPGTGSTATNPPTCSFSRGSRSKSGLPVGGGEAEQVVDPALNTIPLRRQVVHLGPVDLLLHLAHGGRAVRDAPGHKRPDFFAKILSSRPSCHQQAAAEPGKEKLEDMYFCLLLKKQTSQSPKSYEFKLLQRRVDANLEKRLVASDRDDMWNGISQQLSMLHQPTLIG